MPLDDFGPWEKKGFAPEAEFLEKLKAIEGVSQVETQTITNMVIWFKSVNAVMIM